MAYSVVSPKFSVLSILLLLALANQGFAQRIYKYNVSGSDCYSEMIFEETAPQPKGVIVLDAEGKDIMDFQNANPYNNTEIAMYYNFLYVNVLNPSRSGKPPCYAVLISSISFAFRIHEDVFFIFTDQMLDSSRARDYHSFHWIDKNNLNPDDLLKKLNFQTTNKSYRIPSGLIGNRDLERDKRMQNYKRNLDIGLHFTPMLIFGNKALLNQNVVGTYGISVAKNIGTQWSLKLNTLASFKLPDRSGIQSSLQSRMMDAVKKGEKELYINETLSGHMLFGGDLSLKYYWKKTGPLRPYISVGAGQYSVTSISGTIQDTLDISNIDLSSMGSGQSPPNLQGGGTGLSSDSQGAMSNAKKNYNTLLFEYGFEYRVSPVIKLNASLPFRYFMYDSEKIPSLGLNIGLSFTLNPKKIPKR
jgi:hypothetical protein